jgi:hypothetical protein
MPVAYPHSLPVPISPIFNPSGGESRWEALILPEGNSFFEKWPDARHICIDEPLRAYLMFAGF